jgi:hypothetical protein
MASGKRQSVSPTMFDFGAGLGFGALVASCWPSHF